MDFGRIIILFCGQILETSSILGGIIIRFDTVMG